MPVIELLHAIDMSDLTPSARLKELSEWWWCHLLLLVVVVVVGNSCCCLLLLLFTVVVVYCCCCLLLLLFTVVVVYYCGSLTRFTLSHFHTFTLSHFHTAPTVSTVATDMLFRIDFLIFWLGGAGNKAETIFFTLLAETLKYLRMNTQVPSILLDPLTLTASVVMHQLRILHKQIRLSLKQVSEQGVLKQYNPSTCCAF